MTENIEEKNPPCSAGEKLGAKQIREPGRRGRPKVAKTKGDQKPYGVKEKLNKSGYVSKRAGKGSGKPAPEIVLDGNDTARLELLRPVGRPSTYTEEIAKEVCKRLIVGQSLSKICEDPEMPGISTIYDWFDKYPEFAERYAKAKEDQAETLIDGLLAIADEEEDVNRARLKIETRKWIAAKMRPKRYGERIDITKTVDITVTGIKRVIVDEAIEGEVIATDKMICCDDLKK